MNNNPVLGSMLKAALDDHAADCRACNGPDDGCEIGQAIENAMLLADDNAYDRKALSPTEAAELQAQAAAMRETLVKLRDDRGCCEGLPSTCGPGTAATTWCGPCLTVEHAKTALVHDAGRALLDELHRLRGNREDPLRDAVVDAARAFQRARQTFQTALLAGQLKVETGMVFGELDLVGPASDRQNETLEVLVKSLKALDAKEKQK